MVIKKRGQISIFLILGVIIILMGLFYFFYSSEQKSKQTSGQKQVADSGQDIASITSYIQECVNEAATDSLWYLGRRGGHLRPEETSPYGTILVDGLRIPYIINYPQSAFPSKGEMESRLASYFLSSLDLCTDFSSFQQMGYSIDEPSLASLSIIQSGPIATINQDEVLFAVRYPLNAKVENSTYQLEAFTARIPVRLGRMSDASSSVINSIRSAWDNNQAFDISSINCDGFDPYRFINVYALPTSDEYTLIIRLIDYEYSAKKYAPGYIYQFAVHKNPLNFIGRMCTGTPSPVS